MAADNALFVFETKNQKYGIFHGSISAVPATYDDIITSCLYETKNDAIADAKRMEGEYEYLEFGVIDLCVHVAKKRRV